MKTIAASQSPLSITSLTEQSMLWKVLPFVGIYLVYGIGLFIDVMDVDASQYASMAREMLETGNYLQLYNRYQDYLDKPPLLFWLSALSFKLFGISNFAYKLPAFLFSLIGTYATYRLAKLFYGKETGYIAALLLASCQAFFLFNHDVRTDTNLTGAVILAIWQLAEFNRSGKIGNLILGFTGVALAMLAKGPIGLMVPVLAFATDFIIKRQWSSFFKWQWLLGIVWVGLLLLPMCIGLYQQFDLHPEKVMYGQTGTSGLKFFFWTQSFGRLTGENVWKNNADIFFFMHTFLWSFLPWSLLFIAGLFKDTKELFKKKFRLTSNEEAITWGGFIFPYIALSTSKYQLPHYIFVLYPLAAIIAAKYVYRLLAQKESVKAFVVWKNIQLFAILVIWTAIALLILISFPLTNIFLWILLLVFFAGSLYMYFKGSNWYKQLIIPSVIAITGANLALNAHVYPQLFTYQSPGAVARYVQAKGIDLDNFYFYKTHMHSLDFYAQRIVPSLEETNAMATFSPETPYWIYTNADGLSILQALQVNPQIVETFDHFHISTLTLPFLNPNTREKAIEKRFLLKVGK
ncbi:glycosyltransferase family 39 protein [Rhodocytophaga aerolata]|uniref:Glycosyltransferase family 39 protein n=1 Tax=Rhodocytophaga aerolata TaxID=455078 RepID=A0ABT8RFN2_9BACT|nr:glycosyltransferase family 39 protein [Rhodocytophaga aerolata]MDO1449968.1 glycosyltransferase family 39 protein [Rhodocytophaga aerolata]